MHSQATPTAGPAPLARSINLRPVRRLAAVAGAAALVAAVVATAGTGTSAPQAQTVSADLLRWEAVAAGYAGPSERAIDAASARLTATATANSGLTPAQQAEAARWAGLATAGDNAR